MAYLETFDSRRLRDVLGTFTTGVTVVTTRDAAGVDHGVTANSFSSVSLEPPLILWSQAYTSRSLAAFRDSEHFAVNILADDQVALSNHFAKTQEDKFDGIAITRGLGGVPVLAGTVAHFECVKEAAYPAGDHVIYIGRVRRLGYSGRRPLAFAHGRYMVTYAHGLGPVGLRQADAPGAEADELKLARETLPDVSAATGGLTIALSVWGNHGPTLVDAYGAASERSVRAGMVLSVTQTAVGRTFAAYLATEVTHALVAEDLRLHRVADEEESVQRANFETEMAAVREHGLARGREGEAYRFSAPLFNRKGDVILALSVVGSGQLDRGDALARTLLEATERLMAKNRRDPGHLDRSIGRPRSR